MTDMTETEQAELLKELSEVLDSTEPPGLAETHVARGCFAWRNIDVELAEIIFDSIVDESAVLVRGPVADIRSVSFSTGSVTVDVEIHDGRIIGQVIPAQRALITLSIPSGDVVASAESDDVGMFVIDHDQAGSLSLGCRASDESWSLRTSWIIV